MALEVKVTLKCSECDKKISVKGERFTEYSRRKGTYSGILLPDVYVIEAPHEYDGFNQMQISRGYRFFGVNDFEGLVCSRECALRRISKLVGKLKPEKAVEE